MARNEGLQPTAGMVLRFLPTPLSLEMTATLDGSLTTPLLETLSRGLQLS